MMTKRKLKIAMYLPTVSFVLGGGEVVTMMKAKHLSQLGHEVCFVSLKTRKTQRHFEDFKEENPQIKYIELKLGKEFNEYGINTLTHEELHQLYWALSREMSRVCTQEKFDIVYTHYSPANLSIPKGIPLLLSLQGVDTKWWYEDHIAVRLADKLTADSNSIAQGWKKIYSLKQRIEVVHNGINHQAFHPLGIKESFDILYLGRLLETKGIQYLLKAVSRLKKEYNLSFIKVLIIGKGPYKNELCRLADKLKVNKIVTFQDYIAEDEKNKIYNESKVCVFPSYAKEGVLTTMLEAASSGRAIITADCCGMIDFLKDRQNGLLSDPRNDKDLAVKINLLLKDEILRERLGGEARRNILDKWTWKKVILNVEKVLYKTIEHGKY